MQFYPKERRTDDVRKYLIWMGTFPEYSAHSSHIWIQSADMHLKSLWKSMPVRKWGKGEFLSPSSRVRYTVPQASAAIKWLMPRGVSSLGDPTVPTSWISSSMLTKGCYRPWNRGLTLMSLCLERTNIWIPCWWNSGSYCTLNEDCVLGASRTTLTGVRTTLTEMT